MIIASAQACRECSLTGSLAVLDILIFLAFLGFLLVFEVFCLLLEGFLACDLSGLVFTKAGRIILFAAPGVGSPVHAHAPLLRAQAWPVLALE